MYSQVPNQMHQRHAKVRIYKSETTGQTSETYSLEINISYLGHQHPLKSSNYIHMYKTSQANGRPITNHSATIYE